EVQCFDVVHPRERHLVVGPLAAHDKSDLVLAGAFERPIVGRRQTLHDLEGIHTRLIVEINKGHAVSTLPQGAGCATRCAPRHFYSDADPRGAWSTGPGRIT